MLSVLLSARAPQNASLVTAQHGRAPGTLLTARFDSAARRLVRCAGMPKAYPDSMWTRDDGRARSICLILALLLVLALTMETAGAGNAICAQGPCPRGHRPPSGTARRRPRSAGLAA